MTPGEAAYEAFYDALGNAAAYEPYDSDAVAAQRPGWEAAAEAAIGFYRDYLRDDEADDLGTFL